MFTIHFCSTLISLNIFSASWRKGIIKSGEILKIIVLFYKYWLIFSSKITIKFMKIKFYWNKKIYL